MAFVLESSATTTGSNTINAPSGIQSGDLLVATANGNAVPTYGTTGFATAVTLTSNSSSTIAWKVAAAGDVGASTFTWGDLGSGDEVTMMRFSGAPSSSSITSLLDTASNSLSAPSGSSGTFTLTESHAMGSKDSLIIAAIGWGVAIANTAEASLGHPALTGLSGVTFTNIRSTRNNADNVYTETSYAITNASGTYTGFTASWSQTTGSGSTIVGTSAVFVAKKNVTATHSLLSVAPIIATPTGGSAGVTATHDHIAVVPTLNQPSAESLDRVWTTIPKA